MTNCEYKSNCREYSANCSKPEDCLEFRARKSKEINNRLINQGFDIGEDNEIRWRDERPSDIN